MSETNTPNNADAHARTDREKTRMSRGLVANKRLRRLLGEHVVLGISVEVLGILNFIASSNVSKLDTTYHSKYKHKGEIVRFFTQFLNYKVEFGV